MFTRLFLLALAYSATGWFGLQIPYVGTHITLVWLSTGVAVAALLVWGRAAWPGVYLGAFLVNLSIGSSWHLAAGIAVGNTLGPLLTMEWLKRVGFHPAFDRPGDVGSFVAAAGMGMMVSASCGVASLYLSGLIPVESLGSSWLSWWMGDTVGALLAAPFLLTLTRKNIEHLRRDRKTLLLWFLIAVPVAWFAFIQDYEKIDRSWPMLFLTLPLFAWAALRFGVAGAALAGLCFSIVAAVGTAMGQGPFFLTDLRISLFLLWTYMASTVLTGLLITALQAQRLQMESALRAREEKLRGLYELSPVGIALTDMQGRYVEFNEAFRKICGYSAEELKALDYWTLTPKKYESEEALQLASLERTGRYGPYEKEYIRKDGSRIPLQLNGMLINGHDGQKYIWSIVEDITQRKRAEDDLRIAATAFESREGMLVTDANGIILRVNKAFTEITGYTAEEVVGQTPRLLKSGRHGADFYREMWETIHRTGGWQGEVWDRRKNGEVYPKWLTISAVKDDTGAVTHYIGAHFDITERKQMEDLVHQLAFHDPLTKLPNRRLLHDRLSQAMAINKRSGNYGALMFLDLDTFKPLNDTLGHVVGDLLLIEAANRLKSCVREVDTVARFGGDEFVVMLSKLTVDKVESTLQANILAEKIRSAMSEPYQLTIRQPGKTDTTVEHRCTVSIGVTLFIDHEVSHDDLFKLADIAMYQAKQAGRNLIRFYDSKT